MIISKASMAAFHEELDKVMGSLAMKHGLVQTRSHIRYLTDKNMTCKIEFAQVDGSTGIVRSKEADNYRLHARNFGLDPETLGKVFKDSSGKELRITGLNTRRAFGNAPKYPVLAEDIRTGLKYKYSIGGAKYLMAIA
jgi:hypothetical protein